MKEFNINDEIKVKLTEKGIKVLNAYYINAYQRKYFYCPDENGYYRLQLWVFMNIFGPYMHIGNNDMFEDMNILINEDDLMTHRASRTLKKKGKQ